MEQCETIKTPDPTPRNVGKSESRIALQTGVAPADLCLIGAALSVAASLTLRIFRRDHDALFVGQWAPTLLIAGMYAERRARIAQEQGSQADKDRSAEQYVM